MWDMVICKNYIRTASHNNKVFFFCHLAEKIALVKENCIVLIESMIAVKIMLFLFQSFGFTEIFLIFVFNQSVLILIATDFRIICHIQTF